MKANIRTLNKLLKDYGFTNKEVTRYKGEYYLLHILKNNNPVPVWHCKEAFNMENHIIVNYIKEIEN